MNVILEGFWGIGKSTLAHALQDTYGYTFIPEPTTQYLETPPEDYSVWYRDQYRQITTNLHAGMYSQPIVMERSIISTMAYAYVHNTEIDFTYDVFEQLKEWYRANSCLIVFLYADIEMVDTEHFYVRDRELMRKYQEFYTYVVPYRYDLPVLPLNQFRNAKRKDTERMVQTIMRAIHEQRIAQVNVVVFRRNTEGSIEILVLKRNPQKGGFWQTISGGIGPSEFLSQGALRELQEETGIHGNRERLHPVHFQFSFMGEEGYELNEYIFTYQIQDTDAIRFSHEHEEYDFLSVSEAKERVNYESNKTILDHAFG